MSTCRAHGSVGCVTVPVRAAGRPRKCLRDATPTLTAEGLPGSCRGPEGMALRSRQDPPSHASALQAQGRVQWVCMVSCVWSILWWLVADKCVVQGQTFLVAEGGSAAAPWTRMSLWPSWTSGYTAILTLLCRRPSGLHRSGHERRTYVAPRPRAAFQFKDSGSSRSLRSAGASKGQGQRWCQKPDCLCQARTSTGAGEGNPPLVQVLLCLQSCRGLHCS